MSITVEAERLNRLFERVEEVEEIAHSLPEDDERRARLLKVSSAVLSEEGTIRPVLAAKLLGLSEKTVRAWADHGVLVVAQRTPRLLLDLVSVHEISHMLRDLRALGSNRDLLDEVWRRLNDQALIESDDFQESLAQMRRGERVVLRPVPGRTDDVD